MDRNRDASSFTSFILFLTFQLVMDDVGEVGLLTPPEDPQLLGVGLDLASPYAQQVGLNAAHEAAQNRVVLGRGRDHRPVLPAAAEAVAAPFDARQLRLGKEGERWLKHQSIKLNQRCYYVQRLMGVILLFSPNRVRFDANAETIS